MTIGTIVQRILQLFLINCIIIGCAKDDAEAYFDEISVSEEWIPDEMENTIILRHSRTDKYILDSIKVSNKTKVATNLTKIIDFGDRNAKSNTKAGTSSITPIWEEGDMIAVYSLDASDNIMFIDTCIVTNINSNIAKIIAEVAKDAAKYFAVYPYDHYENVDIGSPIDFEGNHYVNKSGIFGDVSIMTAECPKDGSYFAFKNRFSLLCVKTIANNSSTPTRNSAYYNDFMRIQIPEVGIDERISYSAYTNAKSNNNEDAYYIPIYYNNLNWNSVVITYYKPGTTIKGWRRESYNYVKVTLTPKTGHKTFKTGTIYSYTLGK